MSTVASSSVSDTNDPGSSRILRVGTRIDHDRKCTDALAERPGAIAWWGRRLRSFMADSCKDRDAIVDAGHDPRCRSALRRSEPRFVAGCSSIASGRREAGPGGGNLKWPPETHHSIRSRSWRCDACATKSVFRCCPSRCLDHFGRPGESTGYGRSRCGQTALDRLRVILAADLERASRLARWQELLPDAVAGTANLLYWAAFKLTGVHDMGLRLANGAPLSIPDTIVRNTYVANREAIEVAMIGTQLLGVRFAMILLIAPTVLLLRCGGCGWIGAARDPARRRRQGSRPALSGQHLQLALIVMTGGLCLKLPVSIDPRLLWWPAGVMAALLARTQWAFYKKHL